MHRLAPVRQGCRSLLRLATCQQRVAGGAAAGVAVTPSAATTVCVSAASPFVSTGGGDARHFTTTAALCQQKREFQRRPSGPSGASRAVADRKREERKAEAAVEVPLHNEELLKALGPGVKEVRVISEANENLGLLPIKEALLAAKAKALDLLLVNEKAVPPVCRMGDVKAVVRARQAAAKEAAKAKAGGAVGSGGKKVKEVRLTARTDEHDIGVKAGQVVTFLRGGHPVKVTVSFTLQAWAKEEPGRREVMGKLARLVAEAGAGWADPSTVVGAGPALAAYFTPTSTPRPAGDWERVLARLAVPIRPTGPVADSEKTADHTEAGAEAGADAGAGPGAGKPSGHTGGIQATAAAALDGQLSAVTRALLPPDEVLRRYAAQKKKGRAVKAGEPNSNSDFDDRPGGRGRRRRPADSGAEEDPNDFSGLDPRPRRDDDMSGKVILRKGRAR